MIYARIRDYITSTAKTIDLRASFTHGRRKSDIIIVKLRGKHEHTQTMITYLLDMFSEVDIEVPQSLQRDNCCTLIITQKLTDQEVVANERRAKLISLIEGKLGITDQLITGQLINSNQLTNPKELYGALQALKSSIKYANQLREGKLPARPC